MISKRLLSIVFIVGMFLPVQLYPTTPEKPSLRLSGHPSSASYGGQATSKSPQIEDFSGFPGEPFESFYYVREYPYTTLFIVTAVVSGILYCNRTQFRKQLQKVLRVLNIQEEEKAKDSESVRLE